MIDSRLDELTLILNARLDPNDFIDEYSLYMLDLFRNIEQFGITFFYSNNDEISNKDFLSLKIIKNEINRLEVKKIKDK